MLIDERRHLIAEAVLERGAATVVDLSHQFGVSHVTIRSDLEALEQQGMLRRNRGGAVANPIDRYTPAFQERSSVNREAKQAIAKTAAHRIQDGDWILLDAGSTTLYVADHLMQRQITIAVNSIYSANKLVEAPNVDLIQIGGLLYRPSLCYVGKLAACHLDDYHFDRVLLGVNGISANGVSVNNCTEVGIKQKMIECANEIIVLADASKLGVTSLTRIAPLDRIDLLITDHAAEPEQLAQLQEARPEMEVIVA